jgi:formate C-acetyltransferase
MNVERIERLRERMLRVSHRRYRVRRPLSVLDEKTVSEPVVVRKALALDLVAREMPVFIEPKEIIVGGRTMFLPSQGEAQFWDDGARRNLDFAPDAETLAVEPPGLEFYPRYATAKERALGEPHDIGEGYVTSHCTAGFAKVLRLGFGGIRREAEERLRSADPNHAPFLRAVCLCMDAASRLARRYAEEAQRQTAKHSDPTRAAELRVVAETCGRVAREPARSFREALQLLWFTHVLVLVESYNLMALGRLDQVLHPYYTADVGSGTLERDEALELICCFLIKANDTSDLHTDNGLNIMLSGLTRDGEDGTNELTWLFLDAYERVRLTDPQINVRCHAGTSDALLDRALGLQTTGPRPMIYNDEAVIRAMEKAGVATMHARDYCIDACQDLMIQGCSDFYPIFAGIYGIHLLTILEPVMNRLLEFSSFEEFWTELKKQTTADVRAFVAKANAADRVLPLLSPTPFLSATLEGCVETGRDKTEGGTLYNYTGFIGGGLVNVANSAAAIKKLVFEEKKIPASDLVQALERDFEGSEPLRQLLLHRAPKWGNNDVVVDGLAAELADHFCREVLACTNPRGGRFVPGLFTHHQARLGDEVRSTADGRRRGQPLAVSLSPTNGTTTGGPTATILSAARIDQSLCPLGTSLDMTFYGPAAWGEKGRAKLTALVKSYLQLGGIEFQANTLEPEVLRAAQEDPEHYRDLVVRVWGFNAYFVTLKRKYQDELIARTAH